MAPAIRTAALTLALSIPLPAHADGTAAKIRAQNDEVLPPGMNTPAKAPAPAQNPASEQASSPAETKRPRGARKDPGKDAEGTAAPNRFEADTVIKSTYTLDGKPLEVDPD